MQKQNNEEQPFILVLNGPNMDQLGKRETHIYGNTTLDLIMENMGKIAAQNNVKIVHLQSNHEGVLIDAIHQNQRAQGIIINPAALSHTSIALRDALACHNIPIIEVHLSNIAKREEFRQHSYISPLAQCIICGAGPKGYQWALLHLINHLENQGK